MHPLQRDLFRRFVLFLIVIFAFVSAPYCVSSLIVSNVYAAQSDEEPLIAEEEQVLPQEAQKDSKTTSDTEKDPKRKESENISTMSATSETGEGNDNINGTLTAVTDITQFSGSASAKITLVNYVIYIFKIGNPPVKR